MHVGLEGPIVRYLWLWNLGRFLCVTNSGHFQVLFLDLRQRGHCATTHRTSPCIFLWPREEGRVARISRERGIKWVNGITRNSCWQQIFHPVGHPWRWRRCLRLENHRTTPGPCTGSCDLHVIFTWPRLICQATLRKLEYLTAPALLQPPLFFSSSLCLLA